jgi:hypothetical protein
MVTSAGLRLIEAGTLQRFWGFRRRLADSPILPHTLWFGAGQKIAPATHGAWRARPPLRFLHTMCQNARDRRNGVLAHLL